MIFTVSTFPTVNVAEAGKWIISEMSDKKVFKGKCSEASEVDHSEMEYLTVSKDQP